MNAKARWKRAYHLARLFFKNEVEAIRLAREEGLIDLKIVAGKCWARGNTDWLNNDFIGHCKERYGNLRHNLWIERNT